MIREGFRRAPNAAYALVQTVLLQDEALKAANAHIQEYEQQHGAPQQSEQPRGFLDNMRDSIFGRDEPRGSVPRVPPGGQPMGAPSPWGQGGQGGISRAATSRAATSRARRCRSLRAGGGSFLGTAAAAAAGMIGGSLLMGGIRSAMGGHGGSSPAAGAFDSLSGRGEDRAPWSGNAAGSDLARDAGLGDIGGRSGGGGAGEGRAGLFDSADTSEGDSDESYEDDGDAGFDDSGDSDTA